MERENRLIAILNEKTVENSLQRQITLSLERQIILLQELHFQKTLVNTQLPKPSLEAILEIVPPIQKARNLKRSRDDKEGPFGLNATLYLLNPVGVVKVYSKNPGGLFVLSNDLRNNLPRLPNARALLDIHTFESPDWDQFKEWSCRSMGETIHARVKGGCWVTHGLCRDIQGYNLELAGRLEAILAER